MCHPRLLDKHAQPLRGAARLARIRKIRREATQDPAIREEAQRCAQAVRHVQVEVERALAHAGRENFCDD